MLVVMCGLQGVGKTVVAKEIARRLEATVLKTDVIRKDMFDNPIYSEEEKQQVYNEMYNRLRHALRKNQTVILDATFAKEKNRYRAKEVAEEEDAEFRLVEVVCSEDIIKKRLEVRVMDDSEADFNIYLKYKNYFEAVNGEHITINNSGFLEETYKQLDNHFSA